MTTSKREEHPPRLIVPRNEVFAQGGFGTYFAVWNPDEPFVTHPIEDIEYLPLSEVQSMVEEARREAREIGRADMLQELSDEIDAMGCSKAMFSVIELMLREDKIREKAKSARKPEGKAGTTTCTHGTPTDQRWEWCNAAATSKPEVE